MKEAVPYIVHEEELARAERQIHRLHIELCLSTILAAIIFIVDRL